MVIIRRLFQSVGGFSYDGDGNRVKRSDSTNTIYYIGSHYEVTGAGAVTKYYYFGSQRVAMRTSTGVTYLHGDHPSASPFATLRVYELRACLGSSNVASNANGTLVSRQTYYAFGAPRAYDTAPITTYTDFTFTAQKACPERAERAEGLTRPMG